MYISEVVMCIRTWALWRRNFRIGVSLAIMMTAALIVECIVSVKFVNSLIIQPPPFPGFRGCFLTDTSSVLEYAYVTWLVIDAVVLALIAASALKAYQLGDTSRLINVIHRDALMFYVYLLILSIANVIIINVIPAELRAVLAPMEAVCYSVFTSRIILNIRETARSSPNDTEMELHAPRASESIVRERRADGYEVWVHKIPPRGGDLFSS